MKIRQGSILLDILVDDAQSHYVNYKTPLYTRAFAGLGLSLYRKLFDSGVARYLLYRCETSIRGVEVPQSYLIFNLADLTRYICVLSNFKVFLYFGSPYKITIKEIYIRYGAPSFAS